MRKIKRVETHLMGSCSRTFGYVTNMTKTGSSIEDLWRILKEFRMFSFRLKYLGRRLKDREKEVPQSASRS